MKMLVMVMIKVMIKIKFYSLKFFKVSSLQSWVNEVVALKSFKTLPNLFQIDGPINEMLFRPKLLFWKISQSRIWLSAIYISGGNKNFIYILL